MPLKAELDAFRSEFMANAAPEIGDAMVRRYGTGGFRNYTKSVESRRLCAGLPIARCA